ncbi:MAG: hypothetical protein KTR14_08075 [Vampirovibrio sp.]|nr:hypothetical protein [Vampirovibrio sp.]
MTIVMCCACRQPIYQLAQMPKPSQTMAPEYFKSLLPEQYPDPKRGQEIACPQCQRFPFIFHNTGIQVLSVEGELLPCLG